MLRRIFYLSRPSFDTGDDRAKLEGSQRRVLALGAFKSLPPQFSGLRGAWWSTAR